MTPHTRAEPSALNQYLPGTLHLLADLSAIDNDTVPVAHLSPVALTLYVTLCSRAYITRTRHRAARPSVIARRRLLALLAYV